MKMTTVNSAVANNPFESYNETLRIIYGDEYFNANLKQMEAFSRVAYTAAEETKNSKEIEELIPALGVMYQNYDLFAKVWLVNETQRPVNYTDVLTFIMSDADRFMLNHFGYNFWKSSDLSVRLIDGIPDTIHGDNRLIAKKIVKNRLSNEESQKLNGLVRSFKEDMNKFHELMAYSTYPKSYVDTRPAYWPGWRGVHEARVSGWFPFMGDAPEAELEFCRKNNIPLSGVVIPAPAPESNKKKHTPLGEMFHSTFPHANDKKKQNANRSSSNSHSEEELNAAMSEALIELVGQLEILHDPILSDNVGDDIPNNEPVDINSGSNDNIDVYTIDMDIIERTADLIGEYVNENGGIMQFVDDFFTSEFSSNDKVAFSIGTVIKTILTGGKKIVPSLIGVLGPAIDLVSGIAKKNVISKPNDLPTVINNAIPSTTQVAIDESVDKIEGLANLLHGIIAEMCIIRDATDVDTQIDAIDRIAKLLKDNLKMFNNSKFIALIDRFMGKMFDLADQAEAGISGDVATDVVQSDEGSAAMLPATVMPAVASSQMVDDGKPYWMKALGEITSAMRQERGKMKPGFIEQANRDAVITSQSMVVEDHNVLNPNFKVDPALEEDYPWINQICGIAVKNGLAVSVTPFYNMNSDGSYEIASIRIESFVDGVPSKEKSFSIDLGYFLDRRVKMVFNYGLNGFGFMEACDEAYFVFDKNNDKAIDKRIFDAIFKFGISSIKEEEKRTMRMYNSNTTKVNRTIVWITVPTWAVKGEERKALKDSIFKMEKTIRAMAKKNNINFGRFAVYGFDSSNMSYTLDNFNVYYKGQVCNAPHIVYNVTIQRDEKGNIRKDSEGRAIVSSTMSYADNVFGPEGPQFPDDATVIDGSPEQNTELFTTGAEPTSFVVEVGEDEGEVPSVILDPEEVEEAESIDSNVSDEDDTSEATEAEESVAEEPEPAAVEEPVIPKRNNPLKRRKHKK